ncbi:cytochrome P450 [Massarina eburnea CBS 473.64]|uniref:Cytochrome P450 n=1 Tax=Massarina eburnea CBS 473.64 TaxID=1395130 RepID=A0A6A6SJK4_9PLEO|nr:cytochrome P450 [Massarina eburnea CBS 473.64]
MANFLMDSVTEIFSPFTLRVLLYCALLPICYAIYFCRKTKSTLPWVAYNDEGLHNVEKARKQWVEHCNEIIDKGLREVKGAFQVQTDLGPKIVLPNSFAEELRNNDQMLFSEAIEEELMATYSGLTPISLVTFDHVFQDLTRVNLTRSLDAVTPELNEETRVSLQRLLGDSEEWQQTSLRTFFNGLIVRLSTRVFFGKELCQNQEYLNHVVSWGTLVLMVNITLRQWPLLLRRVVHMLHPLSRQLRNERAATSKIVAPIIHERLDQKQQGQKSAKVSDMVGWMEEIVQKKKAKMDLVDGQLFMAFVAVETTSTTVAYLMLDLLDHPDAIPRLRKEIISVLRNGGWKKTSLQQMKLLDSAMKESQRLHPLNMVNMQRKVTRDITLSDGTVLPKGAHTFVRWESRCSAETYPNPDEFVVDRFLEKRESGEAGASSKWQFVTTSPDHMGFGHGRQACPGRFFASNEIKVAMVHLLLKYDWAYTDDGRKPVQVVSNIPIMPFEQNIAFRRREMEDSIDF